jgi:hypothetical protein
MNTPTAVAHDPTPATSSRPDGDSLTLRAPRTADVATTRVTADDRYLLRLTISGETHAKLQRARDLLRHTLPSGDPSAIVDRALTVLIEQLERTKLAAAARPRPARRHTGNTRHIPAAVKRSVWQRDAGRCTFVGTEGRCTETGGLEFHHLVPYARGGATHEANLTLRCRAHNAYDARLVFGENRWTPRATAPATRSGPS